MEKKLYVGNLPFNASEEDLKELFGQAGVVTSVTIIKDRDSGQSKGFAFIEMADQEASQNAIKMFDGYSMNDRELKVNVAKPKEDRRPPFRGPGGNRSGKGGNNGGKSRGNGSNRSNY
jgi:cold-inducible RNA-binding protein